MPGLWSLKVEGVRFLGLRGLGCLVLGASRFRMLEFWGFKVLYVWICGFGVRYLFRLFGVWGFAVLGYVNPWPARVASAAYSDVR